MSKQTYLECIETKSNPKACVKKLLIVNMRECVAQMRNKGYMPTLCKDWSLSACICWLFKDMNHLKPGYYLYEYSTESTEDSILSEKTDFRDAFLTFLSFEFNLFPIKNDEDNTETYNFLIYVD